MSDQTWLITPEDENWDTWLRQAPHDFYHRAAYHAFAERMGEGQAWMAVHGSGRRFMAWPYLVRPAGSGDVDATSVYGYTGPTGIGLEDPDFRNRAWVALKGVWADQGLVALFTRFHPLLGNERHCAGLTGASAVPGGEVLTLGPTVLMDLSHDRETRRMMYPQVLRQEIKRAERAGVRVVEDTGWRHFPEFGELYRGTMQRNTAAQGYMFSDAYLAGLRDALAGCAYLAVAKVGDETAAIMLFTLCGTIAQAHLTGISPQHHALSPLKVLIDGVADICAAHGAAVLHLGAGRGGFEDSLFAFKARFSRLRGSFTVGRWILDADRYAALVADAATDEAEAGRYFPTYRAPRQQIA
jgi:hypothetical protein